MLIYMTSTIISWGILASTSNKDWTVEIPGVGGLEKGLVWAISVRILVEDIFSYGMHSNDSCYGSFLCKLQGMLAAKAMAESIQLCFGGHLLLELLYKGHDQWPNMGWIVHPTPGCHIDFSNSIFVLQWVSLTPIVYVCNLCCFCIPSL